MKHLIFTPLLALIIVTIGNAEPSRFYVGIGGLLDQPMPFFKKVSAEYWQPTLLSPGTHFEIGLQHGRYEWYMAYRASNSIMATQHQSGGTGFPFDSGYVDITMALTTKSSWSERYALAGVRYDLTNFSTATLVPIVGGALSVGRSMFHKRYAEESWELVWLGEELVAHSMTTSSRSETWKSTLLPGIVTELGLKTKLASSVEILALAELHIYPAVFEMERAEDLSERVTYIVFTPSLLLQARYVFR